MVGSLQKVALGSEYEVPTGWIKKAGLQPI